MKNASLSAAEELPAQRNSYDYDDLIRCAHGELFGPTNGRLPLPNMLMMDRVPLITADGGKYGKGEIKAELHGELAAILALTSGQKPRPALDDRDMRFSVVAGERYQRYLRGLFEVAA